MYNFNEIFSHLQCRDVKKKMVAAWGVDDHTISAASQAIDLGLVDVILVGDQAIIEQVCRQENIDMAKFTIVHNPVELKAVAQAVQMVKDGEGDFRIDNP